MADYGAFHGLRLPLSSGQLCSPGYDSATTARCVRLIRDTDEDAIIANLRPRERGEASSAVAGLLRAFSGDPEAKPEPDKKASNY